MAPCVNGGYIHLDDERYEARDVQFALGLLTDALVRLKRGELLGPAMTARFLEILGQTETGPARLPAGLGPGWSIAHKTGTGQDLGNLSTGYNDVGLVTAPDGHAYAVAVMIASTSASTAGCWMPMMLPLPCSSAELECQKSRCSLPGDWLCEKTPTTVSKS